MSHYTVQLFGIMYIHCEAGKERVLIPNGINGGDGIPAHHASLFIDPDLCIGADWWPLAKIDHELPVRGQGGRRSHVLEFRIPQSVELDFPHFVGGGVTNVNLRDVLPPLEGPWFELDLADPDTIAQVPINGGSLQAFAFNGGVRAAQWCFKGPDVLTIRAGKKSVTVQGRPGRLGTEIVLSNTPDFLKPPTPAHGGFTASGHLGHDHHYSLYGKLARNRDGSKLSSPKRPADLPFASDYLRTLTDMHVQSTCVPTCCRPSGGS